jgi:hypothetical protein
LLLGQISLQLAQSANTTFFPITDVLSVQPSDLDVAVNVLWTLSLVASLTCALSTVLIQEWVQEYLSYSRCHPIPSTRARIRSYLFEGLSQHQLDQVISAIPLLLHLGFLLFGAGLITRFFSLNNVVAYTALAAYSTVGALYMLLSISPLINLSSPFKTPISNFLWHALQWYRLTALHAMQCFASCISLDSIFFRFRLPELINTCRERYRGGILRAIEQDLETGHSNIDSHALRWAISCIQTDAELESFIGAIPRFLESTRQNYPQYTIGHLLEDPDVRLGWSIGQLLQTCSSSTCALEPHVRKRHAIVCSRAIWYITEKFAGTTLYWDTLFGAETANSLPNLWKDDDPTVALFARCTAALAARSCLHELTDVSAWVRTKGPHWSKRALHLIDYISKLSGVALPAVPETVAHDGPLLTLGAFLKGITPGEAEVDNNVSFMVNTTVKHLVEGVRAGEATPNAQKEFSEVFSTGNYDLWRRYLSPDAFQALDRALDIPHQDLAARMPEGWVDADLPGTRERNAHGINLDRRHLVGPSYSRWSYESSGTACSGDEATSSSGNILYHSLKNASSLKTVVEAPSLRSRHDGGA